VNGTSWRLPSRKTGSPEAALVSMGQKAIRRVLVVSRFVAPGMK
jgi:hypothetical protein